MLIGFIGIRVGWWCGVTTKPTAAEHMYSVAGQEERRKEKSRRRRTERVESRKEEQKGFLRYRYL
jgi:hypothetical protein